ncbi:unnamed protein product [Dracunculus medinensis]|uniref:Uncharacterized protein n=1 Tax=Dracunculus medinensis TaxID=318479 RepID=A0A158Q4L8_DRAME|nr:unnamed protein product [Dracunculus medinensis]
MSRKNSLYENFQAPYKIVIIGDVCCPMKGATRWCRNACKSAMYAPTLDINEKQKRLDYFCSIEFDSNLVIR